MKITAVLHRPVTDPAGSEQMLRVMLLYLAQRGHTVRVVVTDPQYDLPVEPIPHVHTSDLVGVVRDADVLLAHHDGALATMSLPRRVDVPVVHVQHGDYRRNRAMVRQAKNIVGLIFNSRWLLANWVNVRPELPRCIVYPPVDPAEYAVPQRGEMVTQINLFKNGKLFWEVARLLPETRFLAVKGGYGHQLIPKVILDNVEVIEPTSDPVEDIYARTRILLVPSLYESWGRVGMEAACSGIPAIASTTPGLQESLSYAGLFRDPADPVCWAEAITALSDPGVYAAYAQMACQRVQEVWAQTQVQLAEMEQFLLRQR